MKCGMHFQMKPVIEKHVFFSQIVGFLLIVLIPYVHIGIMHSKIWVPDKKPVDRSSCTCSCWDTIFKGSYENGWKVGYKHLYFNSTTQTFLIWAITIATILSFYEGTKYVVRLYAEGSLRLSMCLLLLIDIHPHYYSWWMYLNYLNDDFYQQIYHQTFFTVTELISSIMILRMCSKHNDIGKLLLIGVVSISVVHIVIGSFDQFFKQMIFLEGRQFQRLRNLGFLIPDVLHVIIPMIEYKRANRKSFFPFSNKT